MILQKVILLESTNHLVVWMFT